MKKAPFIITLIGLFVAASTAFSQTDIIEHKSHSGSDTSFEASADDGFGLPGKRLLLIEKVSDSMVVFHNAPNFYTNDTMFNHRVLKMSIKQIRKQYGERVSLLGFYEPGSKRDRKQKKQGWFVGFFNDGPAFPVTLFALAFFCSVFCLGRYYMIWRKVSV